MLLLVVFVIAPIVEIYGIIRVGHSIGALDTIGLLVLSALVGSWLVRHEGMRVFRRFIEQIAARCVPSNEIADGVVILVAGSLLIAPGFISDVVALVLLVPPIRRMTGHYLVRRYTAKGGRSRIIRASYTGPIVDVASYDPPSDHKPSPPQLMPGSDDDTH